jgi:hypothetical protein
MEKKNRSVASLWDGKFLKCTFRRMGDESSPELWYEVFQLASTIIFKDEEDSLVWQFTSMGVY